MGSGSFFNCETVVFLRKSSPSGSIDAAVYQIDCGATTRISYSFVLVKPNEKNLRDNGLEFYFLNPRDSSSKYRMDWTSFDTLEVSIEGEWDSIGEGEKQVNGINIVYRVKK
jgi:hypothetical protein